MPQSRTDVLIVGAGPTGLLLAILLTRFGVRVRIIDKAAEPGTASRALVVHARTLEQYRQLGIADAVVQRSLRFDTANLWVRNRRVGHVVLGDLGRGLSPFPYLLIFPQDEHERLLIDHLATLGVSVERPTELASLRQDADGAHAVLRTADGEDRCDARYVAGCDGARSRVRESLGVRFPGGTYEHLFYVADVEAHGPVLDNALHVILDESDFLAVFPLQGEGRLRVIGTVREELAQKRDGLTWNDVSARVLERIDLTVNAVHWFSTYHVHHRVAERFQVGRCFLLGDAAHIHSPVGGQGMNTGLGDAANLAWKIADVIRGRANPAVLDTYGPERMKFARRLVATTDRAFTFVTRSGPLARRVRTQIVPLVLPPLFGLKRMRRFMFRTISQIAIEYRRSALSVGKAGKVRGGDRLPWVQPLPGSREPDNFTPLAKLEWQVHVYGTASATVREICKRERLPLHEFAWNAHVARAGLRKNASYLVRPDGYVAVALPETLSSALSSYLADYKAGADPSGR